MLDTNTAIAFIQCYGAFFIMDKEKVAKLRQDIINSIYSNTELSNSEIYEIAENILRNNGLV